MMILPVTLYGGEAISMPSFSHPTLQRAHLNDEERLQIYGVIKQMLSVEQARWSLLGEHPDVLLGDVYLLLKQLDPTQQDAALDVKDVVKDNALSETQEFVISVLGEIAGAGVTFLTGLPAPLLGEGAKELGLELGESLVLRELGSATIEYPEIGRMEIVYLRPPTNQIIVNIYLERTGERGTMVIPVQSEPLRTAWGTYVCSPWWCGLTCPAEAAITVPILQVEDILIVGLHSPCELRVYDSQERVTGLVNGEMKQEIPGSVYDEQRKEVIIFSPSDSYHYQVAGTSKGKYGLAATSVEDGKVTTFSATNVPTASAVHEYTIDWAALAEGEKGVTMKIDVDGDGTFERIIHLSGVEEEKEGLPVWVWFVVGMVVAFIATFVVWRRYVKDELHYILQTVGNAAFRKKVRQRVDKVYRAVNGRLHKWGSRMRKKE